jgi:hypothetical protein
MTRVLRSGGLIVAAAVLSASVAHAEVKTRDRNQVKFEGMLGRMVGMFGGKAAREGIETTTAVKGNRKITRDDETGRIVDLDEQKVYELDFKKKTYTVMTFEQIRQKMREAQERAAREAEKNRGKGDEAAREPAQDPTTDVEVDFDMKESGETKSIAGYDAREVVTTITVRQKGMTLDEGGGLVMTAHSWLGPEIPALKELADFELRYWKAIAPEPVGLSAEQMAAVMAMYPMVQQAMQRMAKEQVNLKGTPLETVTTFEAVKSASQMSQQQESSSGGGGLSGMLARKMMKRGEEKPRATFATMTNQTLEVATAVAPGELDVPAGFKEKK